MSQAHRGQQEQQAHRERKASVVKLGRRERKAHKGQQAHLGHKARLGVAESVVLPDFQRVS